MGFLRRQLAGVVALLVTATAFFAVRIPEASADEKAELAREYAFTPMTIDMPPAGKQQTIRKVNKDYKKIDAWISSVGAGIALNDLDGNGRSDELCITDTRTDQVAVAPAPGSGARFGSFALNPAPLPMNEYIAPMGCSPGDFNEDGRMDLLVYYWGRSPIVFLSTAAELSAAAYKPVELVPGDNESGGKYVGPQWNSNAVAVDDFDGDGHADIFLGNYFPHGPVLNDKVSGGVAMNRSLSNAFNGGDDYVFRWTGAEKDSVSYEKLDNVFPGDTAKGWPLGAGATDLDGDQLAELYVARDHGPDALLHNRSKPGKIRFAPVTGIRDGTTPKSKRIGVDSFKGMGVDFGDLDHDGLYDMFVSNITTTYGIQESSFQFISDATSQADLRRSFLEGKAPYTDRSTEARTAWGGWDWDVKLADFTNKGALDIAQTNGFVKGDVNRWAQLQELAAANDAVVENPVSWPNVREGDDIAGSQRLNFFVKSENGRYVNLSEQLGLAIPVPTRGIAVADTDGDGRLEMAVARQFDEPVFYKNESPSAGDFLGLRLTHEAAPGSPVVGAQVTATTPEGRKIISRVDGGSGHSGKRSHDVHIGLGENVTGPVKTELRWRDLSGRVRSQVLQLTPGWHALQLGSQAKEESDG